MASLNNVQLIGHLGRDVETRYLPNGDAVAALNIATTDKWKDKTTGEAKEATEWHRCTIYGKLAEIAGQYLKKGSMVFIGGKLRTRKYTDKDGVEKYATEIVVNAMQMLDRAPAAGGYQGGTQSTNQGTSTGGSRQRNQPAPAHDGGGMPDFGPDDIPFQEMGAGQAWSTI